MSQQQMPQFVGMGMGGMGMGKMESEMSMAAGGSRDSMGMHMGMGGMGRVGMGMGSMGRVGMGSQQFPSDPYAAGRPYRSYQPTGEKPTKKSRTKRGSGEDATPKDIVKILLQQVFEKFAYQDGQSPPLLSEAQLRVQSINSTVY
jgi:hypothetical protein